MERFKGTKKEGHEGLQTLLTGIAAIIIYALIKTNKYEYVYPTDPNINPIYTTQNYEPNDPNNYSLSNDKLKLPIQPAHKPKHSSQ